MALRTLGTNATTSLNALLFQRAGMNAADVATFKANVKDDLTNGHPIVPGAFELGRLVIPNRQGWLEIRPGDFIAYDSTGWPILLSANAIANGPWTHT
jgi:hypothetical protein